MTPLSVACFSDGRPGHEKQSQAVLAALKAMTPLSITHLILSETAGLKRTVQGLGSLFTASKGLSKTVPGSIDLIIGTGTSTHLPMVGLKLRTGAKLVTCMSPGPLLRACFDLCLVPRHDQRLRRKNCFATFGPPCLVPDTDRHDHRKGLILAGGVDVKSHYWDTACLMSQINELISRSPDITWTLSSSPRTPSETVEKMRLMADANNHVVFVSAEETPRGWIESAYEAHAQVWVTADSVSMIYEALTAGCRVGVLPVKWKHAHNKFQNGIDDLKSNGMIAEFDQWINDRVIPRPSKPLNEAARCAREILIRWWPERLG